MKEDAHVCATKVIIRIAQLRYFDYKYINLLVAAHSIWELLLFSVSYSCESILLDSFFTSWSDKETTFWALAFVQSLLLDVQLFFIIIVYLFVFLHLTNTINRCTARIMHK